MKLVYQACDQSGKTVTSTVDAIDPTDAIEKLRIEGLFVTNLTPVEENPSTKTVRKTATPGRSGQMQKNLMLFTRQFQLLLSTGTPIVGALESLGRQMEQPAWRQVIDSVRKQVEDGNPLSDSMRQHPRFFNPIYCSLISAGESSGKLSIMLDRLANLTRKQVQIRNAIVGALIYPLLLISVATIVMIVMFTVVLPRFEELFMKLDAPLPPSTQVIMSISAIARQYWWMILPFCIILAVVIRFWTQTHNGQRTIDSMVLRLPQFGKIVRSFTTAKIARLLGILLDSHLPLIEVLDLIRNSIRNHHYVELINKAEEAVTRGDSISTAFANTDLIQPTVNEAIRSGEQSGQMATSLITIADFMDEENDVIVKSLTSIIEPIILVFLGGIVGFMAVSMFMPLFDMTSMGG